jgi:putative membrane protein
MNNLLAYLPYCGTPPVPAELASRWNIDFTLIGIIVALAAWHALRIGIFDYGAARLRRASFLTGWSVLALSLISPLCALSVALFSARVTQHMVLAVVAAPLIALAGARFNDSGRSGPDHGRSAFRAAGLFAVLLWAWHSPELYASTFASDAMYWTMHATIVGSAILLWHMLLNGSRENALSRVGAGFITLLQMGLLGALITFAPGALYSPHLLTTRAWNLTALEDQQLGGLIMWIPTSAIFLIAALLTMYSVLRDGAVAHVGRADV